MTASASVSSPFLGAAQFQSAPASAAASPLRPGVCGWIAQKLAVAHPSRVRTMTLLMSWNGDKSVWKPQPQALEAMSAPAPKDRDGYIEHTRHLATIIGSPGTGDMAAAYAATTFDRGLHPAGVMNQMLATQKAEDWSSTLSSLDVPSVVRCRCKGRQGSPGPH